MKEAGTTSVYPQIIKAARPLHAALADPVVQQRLLPVICAAISYPGPSEVWELGGCYPLALGLVSYLGPRAAIWGISAGPGSQELSIVHAFVRVGEAYIDGLGVGFVRDLLSYWSLSLAAYGNGPAALCSLTVEQLINASGVDHTKRDLVAESVGITRFFAEHRDLVEPLRQALERYA